MRQLPTRLACALLATLLLAACASSPPLSVRPADPARVRREQQRNALSAGEPSEQTRIVLRRKDLALAFESDPEAAIARLHEVIVEEGPSLDTLYALAELSFLFASQQDAAGQPRESQTVPPSRRPPTRRVIDYAGLRANGRAHFLAAAVYGWAFLFAELERDEIAPIDPRARLVADLYNHALAAAFETQPGVVELRSGVYPLPFGALELGFDPAYLVWGQRRLTEFLPVADFEVRGLANRYRQSGIGAPLLARAFPLDPRRGPAELELEETVVSTTALLKLPKPWQQVRETQLHGTLDLYRGQETTSLELGGRRVPLEIEPSAALAATLEASGVWRSGLSAFLGRALGVERPPRLFALEPAMSKQIPVVFVHGTNSNPAVWANMVNDLRSLPQIRERFGFWFFSYDSGNPILYSAMQLRRALREGVADLGGPEARPCLGEMVVIGHSQGGLLTKLTAIESGTRFWEVLSSTPFGEAELRPQTRALVEEALFIEPLPSVERVVFISTPHRGSFLASPRIVRRLASRLIQFPYDLGQVSRDFAKLGEGGSDEFSITRVGTSLDNMSPGNPMIRTLDTIPVAPGIAEHSIVAVRGDGPPEEGNDGVVRFSSAHRPDADSELVVRSGHSAQSNPHTINEVERILRLHLAASRCADVSP